MGCAGLEAQGCSPRAAPRGRAGGCAARSFLVTSPRGKLCGKGVWFRGECSEVQSCFFFPPCACFRVCGAAQ